MARRCVTYLDVGPPARPAERTEVALGPPSAPPTPPPPRPARRRRRPLVAGAVAAVALLWAVRPTSDPAPPRSPDPVRAAPTAQVAVVGRGLDASEVAPAPWQGELVRRPDGRGASPVPRVHALAVARADGSAAALVVVDATRRAFPGARRAAGPRERPLRVLGPADGTALRTWQWDEAGYGISLTARGLTPDEQRRVAIAVDVPGGRSLVSGRTPTFDAGVLERLGLAVTWARSGPASPEGGPLLGHVGGASLAGTLVDGQGRLVLLEVVQAPVVTAASVVGALGPGVVAPHVDGAPAAAVLAHDGVAPPDVQVRGWHLVLVDLPGPSTAALASDAVGAEELTALAVSLDLARLARAVAPRG